MELKKSVIKTTSVTLTEEDIKAILIDHLYRVFEQDFENCSWDWDVISDSFADEVISVTISKSERE